MRAVIYGGNILQDFSRIFHRLRIFQELAELIIFQDL